MFRRLSCNFDGTSSAASLTHCMPLEHRNHIPNYFFNTRSAFALLLPVRLLLLLEWIGLVWRCVCGVVGNIEMVEISFDHDGIK